MTRDHSLTSNGKRTSPMDSLIGSRVREERIRRGLTQQNLADALGITYQQQHKYECGVNRIVASRLFEIARILNVPVEEFFPSVQSKEAPIGRRQDLEMSRNFGRLGNKLHRDAVSNLIRALLPPDNRT